MSAPDAASQSLSVDTAQLPEWQASYAQIFVKKLANTVGENVGTADHQLPFADVLLSVPRGREFAAHRLILASHSRYFERIFREGRKEEAGQQRVVLEGPNVDEPSLEAMLKIFYFVEDVRTQLERKPYLVLRLMALAKELLVQEVLVECHNYIRYELDDPVVLEHVVDQLRFSEGPGAPVYKECNEKLQLINAKRTDSLSADSPSAGAESGARGAETGSEPKGRWGGEGEWMTPLRPPRALGL